MFQDGLRCPPRWPQDDPRWTQDAAQKCDFLMGFVYFRTLNFRYRRMAPRWPNTAPRCHKMAPELAHDGPRVGPRWPKDGPKMAQAPRREKLAFYDIFAPLQESTRDSGQPSLSRAGPLGESPPCRGMNPLASRLTSLFRVDSTKTWAFRSGGYKAG